MRALVAMLVAACLSCAGCASTGGGIDEPEPVLEQVLSATPASIPERAIAAPPAPGGVQPADKAPPTVADAASSAADPGLEEVIVEAPRARHEVILGRVDEARTLLQDVELNYVFTGKGKRAVLRGRPVAFAAWSDAAQAWTVVHVEIPRPPIRWTPGRKPFPFRVITPGIEARHVKGTGAERLMFAFSKNGEPLQVYGRKFPVFDSDLIARRRWHDVVRTATPIVYLPANEDTIDPQFVSGGQAFLLETAATAIDRLRRAYVPSRAFPGQLLADVVPAQVIAALAVIEQTDDTDYAARGAAAFEAVLNQYGLKREHAYRYSVSRANAIGPMQFTDRRGNGTSSMVARQCRGAGIDPSFERGATDLLNSMKAAICLFDIELKQMRREIREPYQGQPEVLGIFPVAAYNGGPRNVARLYAVMQRMGLRPVDLRAPGDMPAGISVPCPCLWKDVAGTPFPVTIPRYNHENRGYVQKYQSVLKLFD